MIKRVYEIQFLEKKEDFTFTQLYNFYWQSNNNPWKVPIQNWKWKKYKEDIQIKLNKSYISFLVITENYIVDFTQNKILYKIDFNKFIQYQNEDPEKKRRIKIEFIDQDEFNFFSKFDEGYRLYNNNKQNLLKELFIYYIKTGEKDFTLHNDNYSHVNFEESKVYQKKK